MFDTSIQVLQAATMVTLLIVTGAAISLAIWVIPIVLMGPSSLAKTTQFCHAVELGGRYLQSSSRTCAAAVLLLLLLSVSNDSTASLSTTTYAHALFWLVSIGIYEVYCVFPVNDKQLDRRDELRRLKKTDFGDRRDAKIDDDLRLWRFRHLPRIAAPFIAAMILATGQ